MVRGSQVAGRRSPGRPRIMGQARLKWSSANASQTKSAAANETRNVYAITGANTVTDQLIEPRQKRWCTALIIARTRWTRWARGDLWVIGVGEVIGVLR